MKSQGYMAYGHTLDQHTQQYMAEYIMLGDCRSNRSNNHIEVEAYNAVQDKLEEELVDTNMDEEHQLCDVVCKAHTFRNGIGAQHNSRLDQSDINTRHRLRTGQHLYDAENILRPFIGIKAK
eukprot:13754678-Heterocapsa_arctica.AAC.1